MASLILYVFATLEIMALMVDGQQKYTPIIPSLPPPPTFTPVKDNKVFQLIGNTIAVGEHIHATIDCGPLINATMIDDGFSNPTVRWYKNGMRLSNGSAPNVLISHDERFCVISSTLIAVGGQVGTNGNYTCEVCENDTCKFEYTICYVCDEVSLTSPINDPVVSPFFISLTCGQDVTIPTLLEISFLIISCSVMSGVRPLTREIYKDGVLISNSSFDVSVMSPGNDDFGTYTFVVSSEGCGSAFAVSRIQVPTPTVSVTAPNTQTVGQSLTLQCEVTAVRGITSRVDIVWSSGGTVLGRMNDMSSNTTGNSLVYTDSYTISQLSTTDDGRVIQCEVVINASPSVMANHSITLDVIVPPPVVTTSPSGPIQGAMVGSPQVINCTVNTVSGVESSSVIISWMGPEGSITTNGRISIGSVNNANNIYTNSLQFTYLMEGDEGSYTCNVMILDTSESQSVELQSLTDPTPTVSVTASNTQTVGQSLTLQCEVTAVRGITSRVDIVWSSGVTELERINDVPSTTMGNSLVYTDSYTISQLSTTDEGRVIWCEVVINAIPAVLASDSITLDIMAATFMVTTTLLNSLHVVGNPEKITCTVSGAVGVEFSSVMISWTGPRGVITNDSRVTISLTNSSGNVFLSTLWFEFLMEEDAGTYTCNVTILDTSVTGSSMLPLLIIPTPHLSLDPVNPPRLSEQLILQCQATTIRGITSRLDFMWTRIDDDGEEVVQTVMGANHTNDSLVYTDIYTTPMALSESDVGTVYFCTISLNDDDGEILTNSLNITLDESIGIPPDIDEGPFIPQPDDFMLGNMTVRIGTPVYVVDGFDVTIVCNILNGTPSITITWLRNGVPDPSRGNVTTITVDDYNDGDIFTCRADNIAGFDIVNTIIIVSDKSIFVSIDEEGPISTKERIKLTIDCGSLIDASGISNPIIKWYKNDAKLINGSEMNVVISEDKRQCIITNTLMAVGGQLGTEGTFSCEVCNATFCKFRRSITTEICDVPNLLPPITLPMINPTFVSLTCGQDLTLSSTTASLLIFNCVIFNGSEPIIKEVFKDGRYIGDTFPFIIPSFDNDDFGTYTFKASVERCGSATAVSKILQDTVMFEQSAYSVDENGGPARPALVLSNPSSMEFNVTVTSTDRSATGGSTIGNGVDYSSGPYSVTFPAGVTSVVFNVSITDDIIYEGNENFILTINASSLPTAVTVGDPGQSIITIVDNDVVVARDHGKLRLVGGSNYRRGIVEIFIEPNNTWGIVCDDNWDAVDAQVVCRQLGFGNTGTAVQTYPSPVPFGTPIWLDNVNCNGHESRLIDCPHNGLENHNCGLSEDAGVMCTGDFPKLPIRLVDENAAGEGRVEIFHSNSWATVCDDGWDDTDASVVCRQLGLNSSGSAVSSAGFGQGTGTILLDGVSCTSSTSNIFECRHNGFKNHDCSHSEDAGVRCGDLPDNIVKLEGGNSYNEGRVEVYYNGEWGTVCDDGWDDTDAGVVCRQLGFGSSGTAIGSAGFGQGSGSIWLDSVICTGNESTLASCGHLGVGVTRSCHHTEDAGLRCSGTQVVPVRLSDGNSSRSGRIEMYINGKWGTVCDDRWNTGSGSTVVCRQLGLGSNGTTHRYTAGPSSLPILLDDVRCNGNEANILACPHLRLNEHNCNHDEDVGVICSGLYNAKLRLVDGTNEREGRIEIMYQGIWGTICDDGWDDIDATVVCRELGYPHGNATRRAQRQFGSGTGPVWLRQVSCLGSESKLSHCIHTGAGNTLGCSHARDAGVQCSGVNVRLVDGPTKYEGRVEVYHNGVWGTVCDDLWDLNDAQVVCSELGLGKATAAQRNAFYGRGSGQIWLDNVNCVGTEGTIRNCSHNGWGNENCFHGEDASVKCTADITVMFEQPTYSVNEDDGPAQPVLVLSNPSSMAFNVTVTNTDGTATGGSTIGGGVDYVSGPYTVTFPARTMTSVPFNVSVIDDMILEGYENFTLTINPTSLPTSVTVGNSPQALVTIVDDEVEPPTNVRATVLIPRSVVVTWAVSSSLDVTGYLISYTTTASYTSGGRVTVNSSSTIILTSLEENTLYTITIQAITSDGRISVNSTAVSVTTYTDVPSSPPQNVMVTSINPASLMVSWEPPIEIDHNGPITGYIIQYTRVKLSEIISVNVSGGTTHIIISGLVGSADYSVTAGAINVNGTGPFSSPLVVLSGVSAYVFFNESMYSVKENNGPVQPVLALSNPLSTEISVEIFTTNGSAIGGGVDYVSGLYAVTFPAGVTSVPFNVSIIDDIVIEDKKYFMLDINSSSLPADVTVGNPSQVIVTILDNDHCSLTMVNGRISYNQKTRKTIFKFSSDGDASVLYQCKLDDGKFEDCDGRVVWKGLRRGRHTINLKAFCVDNQINKYSIVRKRYKFRIRKNELIPLNY